MLKWQAPWVALFLFLIPFLTIAQIRNMDFINATEGPKYNWDLEASKHLVLENRFGNVTDNELAGLKAYLLDYPLPTHNGTNYYFRNRSYSYMMEWIFKQDQDLAILNKAIDFARACISYRNDNICKVDDRYTCYAIDFSRTQGPVWPNYKKDIEIHNGVDVLDPGAGVFGGVPVISVPARMIAENHAIWEQSYDGKTYNTIANELIEEALLTIDYTYESMVGADNLIRYSDVVNRDDWPGFVFIYNRVFPVMSGAIPLVEALEIFGTHREKISKIDNVNQSMLDYFIDDMTIYEKDGNEVLYYPYSDVAQSKNSKHAQDFVHGSLESRDLQLLFISERYEFPERYVQAIANTIVDVCYLGNGQFANRLDGTGTNSSSIIGFDGYIWYARFRSEIKEIVIDHILDKGFAKQGGVYDAVSLFEIFKLKSGSIAEDTNETDEEAETNETLFSVSATTIDIYPNPFIDRISAKLTPGIYSKVTISDISGKVLITKTILPRSELLELTLESVLDKRGTYLLILSGKETKVSRIIRK